MKAGIIGNMEKDFTQRLRSAGLRVTEPRLAVLEEASKGGHISADDLRQRVTKRIGSVSTQAIYDIVHALTQAKILREVKPNGSVALYELEYGDNHHHVVCRDCGLIMDVPCATGYTPCLQASETHDFDIDEAEVIYWGRCPKCLAKA